MPEIWTSENEPSFDFQKDPNDVRIECDNSQQQQGSLKIEILFFKLP